MNFLRFFVTGLLFLPPMIQAAELRVETNRGSTVYRTEALLQRPDVRTITIPDDVAFHGTMHHRAVPLTALLPGIGIGDHLQFSALDGFVAEIPAALLLQHGGSEAWLAGMVPGRYDVAQRVLDRLPWFVLAVLSAAFVLLMVVFRSVVVPVKAVLLNLLSIGSALGVVVAVFQWGWLRQLVGLSEPVPLVDVIPMLMFAVVFGLSMDYEVFLLSRIREEWVIERDGRGSVVRGLASTAQVISAAAAIMVAVFLAFTLSNDVVVKTIGLGMAVAVFLDATVIRLVLVPATMALLGDLNWWVPHWLDRLLPHIDIDAAVPVTPLDPIPGPARILG